MACQLKSLGSEASKTVWSLVGTAEGPQMLQGLLPSSAASDQGK